MYTPRFIDIFLFISFNGNADPIYVSQASKISFPLLLMVTGKPIYGNAMNKAYFI